MDQPWQSRQAINALLHLPSASHLQYLELAMRKGDEIQPDFQLPSLRTVRLDQFVVPGQEANYCFGPSSRNEKLHSFTIQFPETELNRSWGEACSAHLSEHDWIAGSPSIKTLILRTFVFRRWDDPVTGQLPTFLASFPNLAELVLQDTLYEDAELCSVIEGITKVCKNLKTLWQAQITGVLLDKLIELGKREGVDIKTGEPARQWPIPLEPDD